MTVSQERIAIWHSIDIDELREIINKFIKESVSQVVDFNINSVESRILLTDPMGNEVRQIVHYAYLRYIPI